MLSSGADGATPPQIPPLDEPLALLQMQFGFLLRWRRSSAFLESTLRSLNYGKQDTRFYLPQQLGS